MKNLLKILAGVVNGGVVIELVQNLHVPWNGILGGLVTALAAFINWEINPTEREAIASVDTTLIPKQTTAIDAIENKGE